VDIIKSVIHGTWFIVFIQLFWYLNFKLMICTDYFGMLDAHCPPIITLGLFLSMFNLLFVIVVVML